MTDHEINTYISDIEGRCSTPDYCSDWGEIGKIIEREGIDLTKFQLGWEASILLDDESDNSINVMADTPTKAAALCYLSIKGVEV